MITSAVTVEMSVFQCRFCYEVLDRRNVITSHEERCVLRFSEGDRLPVKTQMPQNFEGISDLHKVEKCMNGNHYCSGIYPFVFLKEGRNVSTANVLQNYCAVNSYDLLRRFVIMGDTE